ncbi:MAG: ABC transporter permease [Chlamydiia bacterium]|nr:ABC transporter permease [Chlamydiia bacterium]
MWNYLIRRLLLLPLTLFCIVLVNFVIINLAPGEPTTMTERGEGGQATRQEGQGGQVESEERYLQFREHYGLTLPILFNSWPWITEEEVRLDLWRVVHRKWSPGAEEMSFKEHDRLRVRLGDQARFVMGHLIQIVQDPSIDPETLRLTMRMIVRGGNRQAAVGPKLTANEREQNKAIAKQTQFLYEQKIYPTDTQEEIESKIAAVVKWYGTPPPLTTWEKVGIFLTESRFVRYIGRVLHLDFGTIRNDPNKTVLSEVTKRFKYSLTLAITPLFVTFFLCLFFGFLMAYMQNQWPDLILNVFFLILYAIPIFVVAPFLVAKVALNHTFPGTSIPIPTSGFSSSEGIFSLMTTKERLFDIFRHLLLPLTAIMYGSLAVQSRLSRTAVLEVQKQDYVRTAYAKGLSPFKVMAKHVGRNAAITILTALAGSLGVVLGGSLIVETVFQIDGFGKFFYEAVVNRDYNVVMFSALAGAFLTLTGYLAADITYTILDPRVSLE